MNASSLKNLLAILVCPVTRQPLRLATDDEVKAFNQRIKDGLLRTAAGNIAAKPVEVAFVRQDEALFYPVRAGLPIMIADEAITL